MTDGDEDEKEKNERQKQRVERYEIADFVRNRLRRRGWRQRAGGRRKRWWWTRAQSN